MAPDLDTLRRIHRGHVTTIPFENLDIHLGKKIDIDLGSVARKIVDGHRGGYCFEQNTLFAGVLERLGYRLTRLGARVGSGDVRALKKTHMTLLVHLEEGDHIADVGFGAGELIEPMPFVVDRPMTQYGRTFTLIERDGLFTLREITVEPRDLYHFTLDEVSDADRVVANHYTSTHPESGFVKTLTVQLDGIDTRWILRGRTLQTIDKGETTELEIGSDRQLLDVLATTFDLHFPEGTVFRSPNDR
ncbi:MAG TPA: arylamine N-acetyltransferase [Actinomycetota bacterium]|nr:arylamine N-acetyltransferase [Actinomycetota bacterium]